jgi:hypothetical protein
MGTGMEAASGHIKTAADSITAVITVEDGMEDVAGAGGADKPAHFWCSKIWNEQPRMWNARKSGLQIIFIPAVIFSDAFRLRLDHESALLKGCPWIPLVLLPII